MSASGGALGTFPVVATAAEAEAFRKATGAAGEGPVLPLTFPMRWLLAPDVRAALVAFVDDAALVLVHEAQSFAYAGPLRVGEPYRLDLVARREHAPERLLLDGAIADAGGAERARIETVLRLIALPEAHAA